MFEISYDGIRYGIFYGDDVDDSFGGYGGAGASIRISMFARDEIIYFFFCFGAAGKGIFASFYGYFDSMVLGDLTVERFYFGYIFWAV